MVGYKICDLRFPDSVLLNDFGVYLFLRNIFFPGNNFKDKYSRKLFGKKTQSVEWGSKILRPTTKYLMSGNKSIDSC